MKGDIDKWFDYVGNMICQEREDQAVKDRRDNIVFFIRFPIWHIGGMLNREKLQADLYDWENRWWWNRLGLELLEFFGVVTCVS